VKGQTTDEGGKWWKFSRRQRVKESEEYVEEPSVTVHVKHNQVYLEPDDTSTCSTECVTEAETQTYVDDEVVTLRTVQEDDEFDSFLEF